MVFGAFHAFFLHLLLPWTVTYLFLTFHVLVSSLWRWIIHSHEAPIIPGPCGHTPKQTPLRPGLVCHSLHHSCSLTYIPSSFLQNFCCLTHWIIATPSTHTALVAPRWLMPAPTNSALPGFLFKANREHPIWGNSLLMLL